MNKQCFTVISITTILLISLQAACAADHPLPPDVQARVAAEDARAKLVTDGLGEFERPWTFNAYVPDDKIVWELGEKPVAYFEVRDAKGELLPTNELNDVALRLNRYSDYNGFDELVEFTVEGNPIKREMAMGKPGVIAYTADLRFFTRDENGLRHKSYPKELKAVRQNEKGEKKSELLSFRVGALFDPLNIKPGKPEPADFDAKWQELLDRDEKEFGGKPPKFARLREVTKNGVENWCVVLDSLGGDVFVEWSVPVDAKGGKKKLPLIAYMQAYGVAGFFAQPWHAWACSIGVNCHSISNRAESAYYKQKSRELGSFGFNEKENETFENCYHVRMLMRDIRAYRWALSQPECSGSIITDGGSQGGFQAMAMAGIMPGVDTVAAIAPWYVDLGGSTKHWRPKYGVGPSYADPVHWISRTKAKKIMYRVGIVDSACPVDGEMALFNAIPDTCAEAHIFIYQSRGHDCGANLTYPRYHFIKRFGKVTGSYEPHGTKDERIDSIIGWR